LSAAKLTGNARISDLQLAAARGEAYETCS